MFIEADQILEKRAEIIKSCGEWTAHNIRLAPTVFTMRDGHTKDDERFRRAAQIVADLTKVPFDEMRVLDLACLEGGYSVEMALHGAHVVGIEGREANLRKAIFAKDTLGLTNLDLLQDDVLNVSVEKYGSFDVILCLGILYHLDAPDIFKFVNALGKMCKHLLIIDTCIALPPQEAVVFEGERFHGFRATEHPEGSTEEQMRSKLWSALNTLNAFLITEPSLLKLLTHAGFSSIYRCISPPLPLQIKEGTNRLTFVAIKGNACEVLCNTYPNQMPRDEFPEFVPTVNQPTWRQIAAGVSDKLGVGGFLRNILNKKKSDT